ncbi:precorrin-6A reductase [Faecalicatena contorta]|uniref:Precorrin-6A reductase n=1 Tax=Faecalicatena fissicatena TaxID=290055 RepID=A0ABS2E972_9FIRM|nr:MULTISPECIES: precorrin-6A reductase [Clostridia]MBM6686663.1 precorrin-6A reductase [Faecalicatena contorta]MBM6710873.1 precorrin-6A reductase [Faecalicatena contorta]MBM6738155.1 precorrin-6A reductase [Faecalicatena fissicatena]
MASILIFAGTTEGRKIAEYLRGHAPEVYVCTATEYGKELVEDGENIHVLAGRLDVAGMGELAQGCQAELVIDATHPFAMEVSKNIRAMCEKADIPCVRVLREGSAGGENAVWVKNIKEAAAYLADKKGNILITTGSKELDPYTRIPDYRRRCFLRVLSTKEAVEHAVSKGFEGKHLIAMQGPFSEGMNEQLLVHVKARYLVTKDSGKIGGFQEKMEAARKAGAVPVVIGRPQERGIPLKEVFLMLAEKYGFRDPRKITLIGVGPGTGKCLTAEAREAIESADVLIGAERMLKVAEDVGVERHEEYRAEKIHEFIQMNSRYRRVAILLSGDTGFYSGAASLKEELKEYDVTVLPGISSVSCMAARIGVGLEGVPLLSIHGRSCNYLDYLREYGRIFLLVSSGKEIRSVLTRLCKYGWKQARVYVGSRLSYPKERIVQGLAERLAKAETEWDGLSVIYIELPRHRRPEPSDAKDEEFIRGKVPMTKSEVRSVILSRMAPAKDAVIYDVGAGTGSVSIQLAKKAIDGTVYAVEKNPEGLSLIHKNKVHFHVSNIRPVHGEAPEALRDLPAPDLAFVGGSGGSLRPILETIWEKNPAARVVVSAITINTVAECMACMQAFSDHPAQILQVQVSKGKKAGHYQMMEGQNPVYIVTFEGEEKK